MFPLHLHLKLVGKYQVNFIIVFCVMASNRARSTGLQLFLTFSSVWIVTSTSDCPLWHSKNISNQCECCDSLNGLVKCSKGYVEIQDGHCMTWNNESQSVEVSLCLQTRHHSYKVCRKNGSYDIPTNINGAQLNNFSCGGYHRCGLHCSHCADGYGPALFSDTVFCTSCSNTKWLWILNLLLQLTMVTLLYLGVIVLQIDGTSSPMNVMMTYSQMFINGLNYGSRLQRRLLCYLGQDVTNFIIAVFGAWNLDFFHTYIPPMCVSESFSSANILLFDYIIALYPFVLTAFVLVCIELYDRKFKIVIFLSFPLRKLFKLLRGKWNPRSTILSTFATFFLLVYSKFLYVSINFLFTIKPYNCDGSQGSAVLLYDPTIRFLHIEHVPYIILALSVMVVFVLLPPLLLLLYPTRLFKICLVCCRFRRWDILHPTMDIFQGWYKDGTQGTRDYRALSSLYMLIRVVFVFMILVLHIMDIKDDDLMEWIGPAIMHLYLAMFFFIFKPYKKNWMNRADGIILTIFGSLVLAQNYSHRSIYILSVAIYFTMAPITLVFFYLVYRCILRRKLLSSTEQ